MFSTAKASPSTHINISSVLICKDISKGSNNNLVTSEQCEETPINEVNFDKTLIWIKAYFDLQADMLTGYKPLGLVLSAEASANVYLNGNKIGHNGVPASDAEKEETGLMDKSFYLPNEQLKAQNNELLIELSSHHSFLNVDPPLQRLVINEYQSPQDFVLRNYLPAFIPLGILTLGFLYSSLLAMYQSRTKQKLLIPLASFFALVQLSAEVSRGLFFYSYPLHDVRMITILSASVLCGMCLLLYICERFLLKRKYTVLALSYMVLLATAFLLNSMESKTIGALLIPVAIGALITGYAAIRKTKSAWPHSVALLIFVLVTLVSPGQLLDIYYYYFISFLFVFFFVQQAITLQQQQQEKQFEQARAEQLERALNEYKEREQPTKLKINSAGEVNWLSCKDICYFKGARDYVEIVDCHKKSTLHHSSLSEMEKSLPSSFLRIHRSYIVNTDYVQSLSKSTTGSGHLVLTTGEEVPVSRRIMPNVRKTLLSL